MPAETKAAGERLQKVLAHAGVASRRKCEEYIRAGRVRVNGQVVTEMGYRVQPGDRIEVDGQPIAGPEERRYYLLYKPVGYLSTVSDSRGRPTARELVPGEFRLYPVGRLDLQSEGLLLFTNDGELAQRLMHPRYRHTKEYLVLIRGRLSAEEVQRLREGLLLEGEDRPARARVYVLEPGWHWRGERAPEGCSWVRVILEEGRKRLIRRLFASLGHPVQRLIRVRMASLRLGHLKPGQGRWLGPGEVRNLRRLVDLD